MRASECTYVGAVVMLTACAAHAQDLVKAPPAAVPLTIIAHVDIMPPHMDEGKQALVAYMRATRDEPGAERIDLVQEVFPNHFDLVEVWRDQKTYEAHTSGSAWRRMRAATNAWLGSPINERVGTAVAP